MAQELHRQTDKVRRNPTWPFPTKLLTQEPKKVRRRQVDTTKHEGALF